MLEGMFNATQPNSISMVCRFVMTFLRPVASLLKRGNIEESVVGSALRLFELITRKIDVTEKWAASEKRTLEMAIEELLINYREWDRGSYYWPTSLIGGNSANLDGGEPFIDICYISTMLTNMIAGEGQEFGTPIKRLCNKR
jgi:hypothetical protein